MKKKSTWFPSALYDDNPHLICTYSFPNGQIKCSYRKPWLNPTPWPLLQVCFSFSSLTFSTPVAGAMAEAGSIFWRCCIGSKLVWNSVLLGVGLRRMDRNRLAGPRMRVRVRGPHLSAGRLGDKTIKGLMVVKQYGGLNPSCAAKKTYDSTVLSGTLSLSFFSFSSLPHTQISFLSLGQVQTSSSLPQKAN